MPTVMKFLPFFIALAFGAIAWFLVEPAGVDREHWDNPIYWQIAYPAICLGCGFLGYLFQKQAWVYGFAAMGIQGLPQILTNLDAELIVVSIMMLAVLSLPPTLAALFGSWIKRHYSSRLDY